MKIIAICAIDQEAVKFELPNAEIHFIQGGVGKTLSAFHLTKAICEIKPDMVINFGTAGTVKHNVDDIIVCNRFVDRDLRKVSIDCIESEYQFKPIKGLPFLEKVKEYGTCNTGDSFVTELADLEGDVVDMEAFAEATVCHETNIPFVSVKCVTDVIGQNSVKHWEDKLADAREVLKAFFSL